MRDLPLTEELSGGCSHGCLGLLLTEKTVETPLGVVSDLAKESFPGATGAGVTTVNQRGRRVTSGATDPLVAQVDHLQYELDEGPCLEAARVRKTFRFDDSGTDQRWPRWTLAIRALGVRSCVSAALVAGQRSVGAIKVYANRPGVFD